MLLYMRRFSFYIYKVSNSVLQRHEMTQKHKNHLFTVGISGKIFLQEYYMLVVLEPRGHGTPSIALGYSPSGLIDLENRSE